MWEDEHASEIYENSKRVYVIYMQGAPNVTTVHVHAMIVKFVQH